MNESARIMDLEDALEQAQHTISFLHNCLLNPDHYKYGYPEQTLKKLNDFYELYSPLEGCIHSIRKPDCPNCQARIKRNKLRKSLE